MEPGGSRPVRFSATVEYDTPPKLVEPMAAADNKSRPIRREFEA